MTTHLYTNQVFNAPDQVEFQNLTVGTTFYLTSDAPCSGLQFLVPLTIGIGSYEAKMWRITTPDTSGSGAGTLIASKVFTPVIDGAWMDVFWDDPLGLTALTAYVVGVASSQGRYAAYLNGLQSSDISNGGIIAPQTGTNPLGSGTLYNGRFIGSLTSFPNQTFGGHAYGVQPSIDFDPGVNPAIASAFMPFF